MYQLNNNYNLGNGIILENPAWKLAPTIDDGANKIATINIVLNDDYRMPFEYDYNAAETWEDADLISFILSQPEFENSTLITE